LAGFYETGRIVIASAVGFYDFVKRLVVKQEVSEDVTGLIGLGALTDATRKLGVDYLAQLVALVSVGLAVINLMPILPLDGGHLAVLAYERVARRSLSEKQLQALATTGLAFVILIFLVVTYKDITRLDILRRIF
jgi:regulator of sigma E protease